MDAIDEHNHQHTYGNTAGPASSVVAIAAQQAIEANKRLAEGGGQRVTASAGLGWRDSLRVTLGFGAVAVVAAGIAYVVGGIGLIALGLVAAISGFLCVIFSLITLAGALKS